MILLHGFPLGWRSWTHQIPALASAGFSVLAPDLRGYNESDRPAARSAYHLTHLVADVVALVRATGHARAHIVGHDWGGIIAWAFAGAHPELLDRLVIVNAPHVDIYVRHIRRPSRQWLRSWYALLFRIPHLSEWVLSAGDFHALRSAFRHAGQLALSDADVNTMIDALARPGALTAALNWYRANAAPDAVRLTRSARTAAPTLVIWGERDPALGVELLEGLDEVAPLVRVHRIARAGHWVQNEAADDVNRVLIDFLLDRAAIPADRGRGSAAP